METFNFENQGKKIQAYSWQAEKPKAIVQIIHGMAEYGKRYDHFARFLNKNGYSVYADDHRAHGATLEEGEVLGNIGKDGFNLMIEDEQTLSKLIKEKHPGKKLILFGHSMGSFISQAYLQRYPGFSDGIILSGSSAYQGNILYAGRFLAKIIMKITSHPRPCNFLDFITFAEYNKKIKKRQTKFDWLSRDENEVQKYIDDPLCGMIFPALFFYFFFDGLINIHNFKDFNLLPNNMPLLIISGDMDPVGFYGKKVQRLYDDYTKNGMNDVTIKLYKEARHELVNELNHQEVFNDVLAFLDSRFK